MDLGIHILEIATGLKDALISAGFTIQSILNVGPGEVALILWIDLYVAKIIFDAAEKAANVNDNNVYNNNFVQQNSFMNPIEKM